MKIHPTALLKSLLPVIALVTVMALSQGLAQADEVTIAGSTTGLFSGLTPGLTFAGNSFNVSTQGNFAALSGLQRLGTFTQAPNQGQLAGNFTLTIVFTLPTGIAGGNSANFTATVNGNVGATDNGGSQITFINPSQTFTFNNGATNGVFTLTLPNFVGVTSGHSVELSGVISGITLNQVPEPATLLLLGTGLTGLAGMVRRRMKRGPSS